MILIPMTIIGSKYNNIHNGNNEYIDNHNDSDVHNALPIIYNFEMI